MENSIKILTNEVCARVEKLVFGYEEYARLLAAGIVIGGHVLLEGPPGIAKTYLAKTFARILGLKFNRIQFTPDLMPGDVTGVYIYDQSNSQFRLSPGPIFTEVLLADEINRTPPKTQSALLEAMQERFVSIDGRTHKLSDNFFVLATQNPIEHEGTYPLPEAQLDRFLFKINMTYPDSSHEITMIEKFSSLHLTNREGMFSKQSEQFSALTSELLTLAREQLCQIVIDSSIAKYIYEIVLETRRHQDLLLGASPRAALSLAYASKFNAAIDDRDYVIPDDVRKMIKYVFSHRLIFSPEVYSNEQDSEKLLEEIVDRVEVPKSS